MMSLIQTMFFMVILQGSLLALTQAKTLTNLSDGCALFGQVTIEGWPIMPLTMVAALILIGVVLQMTALGCSIYAVSGNPLASNSAGISVDRIQIIHLYDCLLHQASAASSSPPGRSPSPPTRARAAIRVRYFA